MHQAAQDGIWRQFISGVIFYPKACEFPDNKMARQAVSKANHWEVKSRLQTSVQTESPQIAVIASRFLRRKTFSRRRVTWKAQLHFSAFQSSESVYVCKRARSEEVCFFLFWEREKIIQPSSSLNRQFQLKAADNSCHRVAKWSQLKLRAEPRRRPRHLSTPTAPSCSNSMREENYKTELLKLITYQLILWPCFIWLLII